VGVLLIERERRTWGILGRRDGEEAVRFNAHARTSKEIKRVSCPVTGLSRKV